MSVPANFKTAIESRHFSIMHWLEIEGIPRAYGSVAQDVEGAILTQGTTAVAATGETWTLTLAGINQVGIVKSGLAPYFGPNGASDVRTADSVANSITGDLDLRIKMAATDWTPATDQAFFSKSNTGAGQRSWDWYLTTAGALVFRHSSDGTNWKTATSSINLSALPNSAVKWLRVTLDVDNGAAGHDVTFYTSDDGVTWTRFGTVQTTAGVSSIFNSTSPITVGTGAVGLHLFGRIYWADVRSGIGGAAVNQFDPITFYRPWMYTRDLNQRFERVMPYLEKIPSGVEQTLDVLDAVAKSVAQLEFSIVDLDGEPTKWAGVGAQASWVTLPRSLPNPTFVVIANRAPSTVYTVGQIVRPAVNRNGHRYRCTVGGTSANAGDPAFPTTSGGTVADGTVTWTEEGGDDLSLEYSGTDPGFGTLGVVYIGSETIGFSGHDTSSKVLFGLVRGLYRSKAVEAGIGHPVSLRPYTLAKRRCWYNQCAVQPAQVTALRNQSLTNPDIYQFIDADRAVIMSGTSEGYRLDTNSPATYIISVQSLEKSLTRNCFRDLRQVRDTMNEGITGPNGDEPGVRPLGMRGDQGQENDSFLNTKDATKFTTAEKVLIKVDNEVLGFEESSGALKLVARGLFGTRIEAHDPGFVGQEVAGVIAWSNTAGTHKEREFSLFDSTATTDSPLPPDHPLIILLQLLLSTGEGVNYTNGKRNYDVLPESWGLGIDVSRVDVAGIETAARSTPELRYGGVIEQAMPFLELCKNILVPLGYYANTTIGDLFTIKYLRPPLPDESSRPLTNAQRIRNARPTWDANLGGVIKSVVFNYAYDLEARKFSRIHVEKYTDAEIFTKGEGRELSYDALLLYPGGESTVPGTPPSLPFDVETTLLKRADFFKTRFTRPPPLITERVDYSFLDAEVGDLVALTAANLPNPLTGLRGLIAEIGEIVKKRIDFKSKTIELAILQTGYQVSTYRYIAPSARKAVVVAGNEWRVWDNEITEAINGALDLKPLNILGVPTAWLAVGDFVSLWDDQWRNYERRQVIAINYGGYGQPWTNSITFDAAVGITWEWMLKDRYANNPSDTSIYAWGAADDGTLNSGTPHRYYP